MWFAFDGLSFETFITEEDARKCAEEAMQFWIDDADEGWNELSTGVCYGKVTHSVTVDSRSVTSEDIDVPVCCDTIEDHRLVPAEPEKKGKVSRAIDLMVSEDTECRRAVEFTDWLSETCGIDLDWRSVKPGILCSIRQLADEFFEFDPAALENAREKLIDEMSAKAEADHE